MGKEKTTFLFLSGVNTKTCSLSYADAKISLSFSSTLFQMELFFLYVDENLFLWFSPRALHKSIVPALMTSQ